MYSRYPGFIKSTSNEVRILANIAIEDQRSVVNIMTAPKWELKKKMPFQSKEEPVPWRMSLLTTLVSARINKT